ncbi:protein kinase [bacterium]|nr:protein kinase [bacterium]
MDCNELEELLTGRSVLDLSDEERDAVASHVSACEPCWVKWGLDEDSQSLHQLGDAYPPFATLRDEVMLRLSTGAAVQTAPLPAAEEDRPSRIGGFEILAPLGKGGMGTVYKARQVSMERVVALKLLPRRLEKDEAYVARFFREARSAAELRHQNIVQAYDVGRADGRYFFAMEYVDGDDLRLILRGQGPLPQERALKYLKQTCEALAAAHSRGIIHRDIKPSNLIIDSDDCVRVADFGLAKRTEGDVALTADGQALGTPAYVAPELASGKKVDGRADLYSLGATFFRLLSGRPLFYGASFAELVVKHVNEAPPLLQEAAPQVDRRLCHIIDRLLAKDPDDRFDSATDLSAELDALGDLGTAEAGPAIDDTETTLVEPAPPKKRRTPPHIMVVMLLAFLAALYLPIYLLGIFSVRPAKPTEDSKGIPIPVKQGEPGWRPLFDGVTLNGWKRVDRVRMYPDEHGTGESGAVRVERNAIVLEGGDPFTVLRWTGDFPRINYEVRLEAMRREGHQCFCNLFFPVGVARCSLTVGGWQENLIGLDVIDGLDPRQNGTGKTLESPNGEWIPIRLRVTESAIRVWVRGELVIDLPVPGHTFTVDERWEPLKPFSLVTAWGTTGGVRRIAVREIDETEPCPVVLARDPWRDSGRELVKGRRYTLTATGRWGTVLLANHGPEGDSAEVVDGLVMPGAPPYSLIGRIGPDGEPFAIGGSSTVVADRDGRLYLQMNDDQLDDNIGSMRVSIEDMER